VRHFEWFLMNVSADVDERHVVITGILLMLKDEVIV
jgi:hypothetical protein